MSETSDWAARLAHVPVNAWNSCDWRTGLSRQASTLAPSMVRTSRQLLIDVNITTTVSLVA